MRVSLELLIGQKLTAVRIYPRSVVFSFDNHYALTIFNPILLTNSSGDVDCSHHRFEELLRELIGHSVSDINHKRGKVRRVALVFADAVVSIGLTENRFEPAMMLTPGLGVWELPYFVRNRETRLDSYPSYPFDC